jgi:hypothetical protein
MKQDEENKYFLVSSLWIGFRAHCDVEIVVAPRLTHVSAFQQLQPIVCQIEE